MCVILFSYQPDTANPLILGANRDEFFNRPTANANFWQDAPHVLAGRDLQAGGTWLGITQNGRFAAITNVREPNVIVENARSRGDLTRNFLIGQQSPLDYLKQIEKDQHRYAGFNLLIGEFHPDQPNALFYLSNRGEGIEELTAGTYGLSNHLLDSPWPKVNDGKEQLRKRLQKAGSDHSQIRKILENPDLADDERLPSTGVSYEREKALSAMFIVLPDYGTRTSTVLTINHEQILFSEQNYAESFDGEPHPIEEPSLFILERKCSLNTKTAAAR